MATASAYPGSLVIGIDASADGMVEASRRAARPAKKGGMPNALFVVAAAEALPPELNGCADAVTIQFPWGSLLRGLLTADAAILAGIAGIARPGAHVTVLLSVTPRDNLPGIAELDERALLALAGAYAAAGLDLIDVRAATGDDLAGTHSSWAKRLATGSARPVWRLQLRRAASALHEPSPAGGDTPDTDAARARKAS